MNLVASLAAGLPNAAVLNVHLFTKGVSHESNTHNGSPGPCVCVLRSFGRRAERFSDAGLFQETRAVDGKARREEHAGLLARALAFDGKVVKTLSATVMLAWTAIIQTPRST